VLQANASDPEDDVVSSAVWSTDFSHPNASSFLGEGTNVKAVLYSNVCAGIWHTITFTAKDSQGVESIAVLKIFIGEGQPC
jgi:hypothetical protein